MNFCSFRTMSFPCDEFPPSSLEDTSGRSGDASRQTFMLSSINQFLLTHLVAGPLSSTEELLLCLFPRHNSFIWLLAPFIVPSPQVRTEEECKRGLSGQSTHLCSLLWTPHFIQFWMVLLWGCSLILGCAAALLLPNGKEAGNYLLTAKWESDRVHAEWFSSACLDESTDSTWVAFLFVC